MEGRILEHAAVVASWLGGVIAGDAQTSRGGLCRKPACPKICMPPRPHASITDPVHGQKLSRRTAGTCREMSRGMVGLYPSKGIRGRPEVLYFMSEALAVPNRIKRLIVESLHLEGIRPEMIE